MDNINAFFNQVNSTNTTNSNTTNGDSYNEKELIIAIAVASVILTASLVAIIYAIYKKPYDHEIPGLPVLQATIADDDDSGHDDLTDREFMEESQQLYIHN